MSKFNPRVGVLYTATKVSASGTEVSYRLRCSEVNPSAFREICRMIDCVVYPRQNEYTQTSFDIVQQSEDARRPVVVFWRECTAEDLRAIQRLWQKENSVLGVNYVSFNDWKTSIMADDTIPLDLKMDMWKVFK
ncbi:hypothetical protein IPH92_03055 [Candidatus Kaiserbacteria bacterium]|nr:MAG: hypothetical protein IPH92_03055 [Candidatus Kaiserbacteria bacterium]